MKVREKEEAIKLRKDGFTYREIIDRLAVSRGSLSYWLRNVELSDDQQRRIYDKNLDIRKKFIEYNKQKHEKAVLEKDSILNEAYKEIGNLSRQELKLIGVALYWAEGYKADSARYVEFVNSDPSMIRVIMRWFRDVCNVPDAKFKIKIQLHKAEDINKAQEFWSLITGVPIKQFTRPYIKISPTSQKKVSAILKNGICHIRVSNTRLLTTIRGWICGISAASSSSPA